jgi:hypothetical protein
MPVRVLTSHLLMLASLTGVLGCGGGVPVPKTTPTSGTVMYNGQPVQGATVSFWAENAPRAATGVTDAQGQFTLSMFKANDGAIVGENKITVSKVTGAPVSTASPEQALNDPTAAAKSMMEARGGARQQGPKSEVPAKYGSVTSTTLKETITEAGPNQFVLQLTD